MLEIYLFFPRWKNCSVSTFRFLLSNSYFSWLGITFLAFCSVLNNWIAKMHCNSTVIPKKLFRQSREVKQFQKAVCKTSTLNTSKINSGNLPLNYFSWSNSSFPEIFLGQHHYTSLLIMVCVLKNLTHSWGGFLISYINLFL